MVVAGAVVSVAVAPELAAHPDARVDERHPRAGRPSGGRRGEAGRPGAEHGDVVGELSR
jgi:hypothetical protein